MNTPDRLLNRLLRLFPVKLLKEYFHDNNSAELLYDSIVDSKTPNLIKDFAYSNINMTKQHIYIFELSAPLNTNGFTGVEFPINKISQNVSDDSILITASPIVDFDVYLSDPFEQTIIQFNQPYIVKLTRNHLIIQATIIEKKIGAYIDGERQIIKSEKTIDEKITIESILNYFSDYAPSQCDLNRGIKYLWENDVIDSKYVKWKKHHSTTTEAMDENYTLKVQYPDIYQALIESPLNRTIFKYLPEDEAFPDHFTVDPSVGELSVSLFPKNINQIQNVITQILSNN